MADMRGLLSDPLLNVGMGLLGSGGNASGAYEGLLNAQKSAYQAELMKQMQAKREQEAQAQEARQRLATMQGMTPARNVQPGQVPDIAPPRQAYNMDPMRQQLFENMAQGAPGVFDQMMEQTYAPPPAQMTDDIQEYQYAQQNPNFTPWMRGMKRSGATRIQNIQDMGKKKLWETSAAEGAKSLMGQADEMDNYSDSFARTLEAEKMLDSGMYTGTLAQPKLGVAKFARAIGFDAFGDDVKNTEAFASMMGNETAQIIKQFGAGTGLSDADREYAEKIAGGKITLDERAIRELMRLRRKWILRGMKRYQRKVNSMIEKAGGVDPFPWDISIQLPEGYDAEGRPKMEDSVYQSMSMELAE